MPVVLYDGACALCNTTVTWVARRDRRRVFQFASLQSEAGRQLLERAGAREVPDSLAFLDEQGLHWRSAAAIGIARQLGLPWSLGVVALVVPRPLRDAVYTWVASHRYRWFGRHDQCMLPDAELAARFLDAGERRGPVRQ